MAVTGDYSTVNGADRVYTSLWNMKRPMSIHKSKYSTGYPSYTQ